VLHDLLRRVRHCFAFETGFLIKKSTAVTRTRMAKPMDPGGAAGECHVRPSLSATGTIGSDPRAPNTSIVGSGTTLSDREQIRATLEVLPCASAIVLLLKRFFFFD
jgi:hypothetical protein